MNILTATLYTLVIPVATYFIVRQIGQAFNIKGSRALLVAACLVFVVAIYVPSPPIHGQDTQFFTHVLGGIFTGMIWLYFRPATRQFAWYWEIALLFAITSSLGVLNELYELFAHEIGINSMPLNDTSWDLLANTLGVTLFYGFYQMRKAYRKLFFSR